MWYFLFQIPILLEIWFLYWTAGIFFMSGSENDGVKFHTYKEWLVISKTLKSGKYPFLILECICIKVVSTYNHADIKKSFGK